MELRELGHENMIKELCIFVGMSNTNHGDKTKLQLQCYRLSECISRSQYFILYSL